MTVTIVPIIEPEPRPAAPLAKVMTERLSRLAKELQQVHLKDLEQAEPLFEDLVVYIGYTSKYNVRWRVVNDVPRDIEHRVAEKCAQLGYVKWKTATVNTFNGNL